MLFTGRGDKGSTSHLGSATRVSKTSPVIEALGELDELGSLLGVCKAKSSGEIRAAIERVQEDLFIIQAEVAGARKEISSEKVKWLEDSVNDIETRLPPISTFFVAGGTELSGFLDYARTVSRRAERRVVALHKETQVRGEMLAYMNRLSSLLYALARLSNKESGITEKPPRYE